MWKTVLKWAVAYTMATQVKRLMGQKVVPQVGHYLSNTGAHLSQNLARDGRRIIGSIVASLFGGFMATFNLILVLLVVALVLSLTIRLPAPVAVKRA